MRNDNKWFIIGVIALLFIMCFRSSNTGEGVGDLKQYVNLYLGKSSMYAADDVEPGIRYVVKILNILPTNETIFIFSISLLVMAPIIFGIDRYSGNKIYSLLLIFAFNGVWLVVYLAMRQALSQTILLSAFFVYLNRENISKWRYYVVALLVLSTFFHSTVYIVIPLAMALFFLPYKKKYCYFAMILSLLLSGTVSIFLASLFNQYFGGFSEIDRVTIYIENESWGLDNGYNILNFAPLTLLALIIVFYNKSEGEKQYFVKALVLGVVLYNLLGNIPLVNRAVSFFFIVALIGAVPKVYEKRQYLLMSIFMLYFIWRENVHYAHSTYSAYLPYHFIWE